MGTQRKRRWDGKRTQQQKKHGSDKKTPESLIAQGNLQEAVRLLRGHIRTTPTDEKKRLLGACLVVLEHYQEAAAAWLSIQEKTADDLQWVGVAYLNAKDWEHALQFLDESIQLKEDAYTYYLLALTHLRGELWNIVGIETNQRVLDLLQHARTLPGCPARGYLLLDQVLWSLACDKTRGEDDEVQEQARDQAKEQSSQVLEEAFRLYPDHDEVRLEFAKILIYKKQYEAALVILAPLVDRDERSEEAVAWAIDASIEVGLFEKARHYLDLLPPTSHEKGPFSHSEVGLDKLRGDIFLRQGNFKEALACYENERQSGAFVANFIGTFSCAWVWLFQEQREQSTALAREGAALWFEQDNGQEQYYAFDYVPISIGPVYFGDESPALCVRQVCERLLADDVLLDPALKGQLSYLLYRYHVTYYEDRPSVMWKQKAEHEQLLLQAAQLYLHHSMSGDLWPLFLKMGDIPRAIAQHLTYCMHLFARKPEYFEDEYAEFAYKVTITTEEERRRIHETALGLLQACHDTGVIKRVFLPFFTSFWCPVLQAGQMIEELVTVTKIFMDASSPEVNTVWFYHAWGLSILGKDDEAERIYRQLLEHTPDDADALHNLALLVEEKSLFQEALALSNRAAALAPDDEIITNENSRLKREYEEREQARQQQEQLRASSQERVHHWSLLSDNQKRLLCLMELHPSAHWSALFPYVKNDEHQLRQVQEDWEWLLAHGVCSQAETGTSVRAVPLLQPCVLEEGFRCWLSAEIARVQARKKKNLWLPAAADLGDEQLTELSSTQRDLMQQVLMRQIERVAPSGLEQFHLRFYRRIWKQLLIEWKMYAALVDLCEQFLTRLSVMTRQELSECAYYATGLSSWPYQHIAEKRYKEYLAQEANYAAYHNLSIIYLKENKYHDALQMIDQALQLNPSNVSSINQKARIEQAIKKEEEKQAQLELQRQRENEQREQHLKDLEQKIQAHLTEVDYYKRNILQSLKNASYYRGKRSFAKYIGMEEWALNAHWRKLVSWGMIVEEDRQTIVHPLISAYLEQGWQMLSASSVKSKEPKVTEASSVVVNVKELVMGDQIRNQIGDISNISGQLFIGKFNTVIADLMSSGQTELAEALKTLEEAVIVSEVLLDDEKQEQVGVINHIGEEAAKPKPNKTLLKVLGDGLMTTLKSVPDVANAVAAVAPVFAQWHH